MADSKPLSTQMQALIKYANETTGEADSDLSSAVDHLVDGYGGGGGASDFELVETLTLDGTLTEFTYTFPKAVREFMLLPNLTFSSSYTVDVYVNGSLIGYVGYNYSTLNSTVRYVRKLYQDYDGLVYGSTSANCMVTTVRDSVTNFRIKERYNRGGLISGTIDIYAIYA